MIKITTYVVGELYTNCYVVEDTDTGSLLVVDPGATSLDLIEDIHSKNNKLEYILLTHGHSDHIQFVKELKSLFGGEIVLCSKEKELLEECFNNTLFTFGNKIDRFEVDKYIEDGDTLMFGNSIITFMHTPGHSMGSGIYIINNTIFSGDTIFNQSIGRTDFKYSSPQLMIESIKKINELEGDFNILPGHDAATTLLHEKAYNPFFP